MVKEADFETYLSLSKDTFEIFLLDNKSLKNLYQSELELQSKIIDLEKVSKYDDNSPHKGHAVR